MHSKICIFKTTNNLGIDAGRVNRCCLLQLHHTVRILFSFCISILYIRRMKKRCGRKHADCGTGKCAPPVHLFLSTWQWKEAIIWYKYILQFTSVHYRILYVCNYYWKIQYIYLNKSVKDRGQSLLCGGTRCH